MPSEVQKRMRFLREQKGDSQETVAKFLNINRNTYANQENSAKQVKDETIEKLASYYKVSVNYLRYGIKEEKPPEVIQPKGPDDYIPILTNADMKILDMLKCLPPKIRARHRAAIEEDFKIYNNIKNNE